MNAVADPMQPDTVYFSWTADAEYGKAGAAGAEGRVYVAQLTSDVCGRLLTTFE